MGSVVPLLTCFHDGELSMFSIIDKKGFIVNKDLTQVIFVVAVHDPNALLLGVGKDVVVLQKRLRISDVATASPHDRILDAHRRLNVAFNVGWLSVKEERTLLLLDLEPPEVVKNRWHLVDGPGLLSEDSYE